MRVPILWRFVVIMVLFLIVPIAVCTLLLQAQIQDSFSQRIKDQMQNSLLGFSNSLRTEVDLVENKLIQMVKSKKFLDLIVQRKNKADTPESDILEGFYDFSLIVFSKDQSEVATFGNLSRVPSFFTPELIKKSESQYLSFLTAGPEGLTAISMTTLTSQKYEGYTIVLQYHIHNALFDSLRSSLILTVTIALRDSGIPIYSNKSSQFGQMQLDQLYPRQVMHEFSNSDQNRLFSENETGSETHFGLYEKTNIAFFPPVVFHISLPNKLSQPFDASVYLVILSVISIVLALVSSIILLRRVVRPLTYLSTEVNKLRYRLRNGQETQALRMDTNDEISDVAYAFNGLVRDLLEGRQKIDEQRAQIVSYAQNLEERVRDRTRELEEAKIRAEIASNQKSRFLVNMNHELRTPLNSISGVTDLLRFGAYEKTDLYAEALLEFTNSGALGEKGQGLSDFLLRLSESIIAEGSAKKALPKALENLVGTTKGEGAATESLTEMERLSYEEEESILGAYNAIRDAGETLLNIINEVINLSRIESGIIEVHREKTKFVDIVSSVMIHADSYLRVKGKKKVIEINHSIDARIPEFVEIDGQKVKQVFLNFMTNAIKYTKAGTIQALVNYVPQPRSNFIRFTVIDTGIGIAEKDKAQLFLEFSRAFEVREIEGTGLGLALSRKLVERMGGSVGFESELGKGSTFWFTIPIGLVH